MDILEKLIKTAVLSAFFFLNAIDMVQTLAFLRMGIEGNFFVVYYPQLWFLLKFLFTFGLPVGLYRLDSHLEAKEDEGVFTFLNKFVAVVYIIVFFADVFYLSIILRNISILGRFLP